MAKLYHKDPPRQASSCDLAEMSSAIESFLSRCSKPAVLDFGDQPIRLSPYNYILEIRSGKLAIDVWDEDRSLSRKILSINRKGTGLLECTVQRFGNSTGTLTFLDLDRPQTAFRTHRGLRQNFAEQFRRMLHRQFPGWQLHSLSSAPDLRRSFSATFPRALLSRGNHYLVALACPASQHESALLSFALIWFDYCRLRVDKPCHIALCLFLPDGSGAVTAHRLRWLAGHNLTSRVFRFNEHGLAGEVDRQDLGNIETHVNSRIAPSELSPDLALLVSRLAAMDGVSCCPDPGGTVSLRYRGLEFARVSEDKLSLGIDHQSRLPLSDFLRIEEFARHLVEITPARTHSELPSYSERWFEGAVRAGLPVLDPDLLPGSIHSQVLTFAGLEREVIDLLSVSSGGQLSILELKTAEDLHLPMQGLDYWISISHHARRRELDHLFRPTALAETAPRLLLIAPALSFHPANEIVLRYFSPEIDVQRIGVNSDWDSNLQVLFRLKGAEVPISHRSSR